MEPGSPFSKSNEGNLWCTYQGVGINVQLAGTYMTRPFETILSTFLRPQLWRSARFKSNLNMENYIKVIIITMIILMLLASSLFIYPPSTIACNLYSFLSIPFRPEQVKVIRNLLNSFQFIKKNSISCSSTFSGHIAVETKRQALPPRGIQGCRYQRFLSSSSGCRLQYP